MVVDVGLMCKSVPARIRENKQRIIMNRERDTVFLSALEEGQNLNYNHPHTILFKRR